VQHLKISIMKKQIKIKKLNLSKETMGFLTHQEQAKILGGDGIVSATCPLNALTTLCKTSVPVAGPR
jgi:hypothetical protein